MDCLYTCVVSLFWWKLILFFVTLFSFRILIGTGRVCIETLRPLAYSILAEMVHHIRMDMSMPQVALSLSLSQVSSPVFICVCSHAHKKCAYTRTYEQTWVICIWIHMHMYCEVWLMLMISILDVLFVMLYFIYSFYLIFQLSRIIYLFSRNMHDSSLSIVIQTTCARLMLNLVLFVFFHYL